MGCDFLALRTTCWYHGTGDSGTFDRSEGSRGDCRGWCAMPSSDVYWLALRRIHGVGPRTCKLLIEKFGAPEKIFQLNADQIAAAGVPRNTAQSIAEFRDFEPLEKELCELPNLGVRLVKWTDAEYPPNLRQI